MAKKISKKPAKGMIRVRLWATEEVRYRTDVDMSKEDYERLQELDHEGERELAEEVGERWINREKDVDDGEWTEANYEVL